jgi:hypothetical protein
MSATENRFELLTLERLREIYDLLISTPPGVAAWGTIGPGTGVGSQVDLVAYLNTNYLSSIMNTNRILGRTTAGSGAVEEISIGIGLEFSAGVLKSTDFDFSLNFQVADPYIIILPYNFRIDSVTDPGPITYTITVNALPYTLGNTINAQDIVEVTPGAIGWINLNCTRLT